MQRYLFNGEAHAAHGKGLRPATEATSRGRILPPTRRTPAPISVASLKEEVAHSEHVVDCVGVGVVEVSGCPRQNGDDVVAIDLDLGPSHVSGVAEFAAPRHCVGNVHLGRDPVELGGPSQGPKRGEDAVDVWVLAVSLPQGGLARGVVDPGDPQWRQANRACCRRDAHSPSRPGL